MEITNRVYVITGAGSGLGAAVARMVVGHKGKAMLLAVNADPVAALAHELGAAAHFKMTDVSSEADGEAAVATAIDAFGRVECLITAQAWRLRRRLLAGKGPTV